MAALIVYKNTEFNRAYRQVGSQDVTNISSEIPIVGSRRAWFGHCGKYYQVFVRRKSTDYQSYMISVKCKTVPINDGLSSITDHDTMIQRHDDGFVDGIVDMIPCGDIYVGVFDVHVPMVDYADDLEQLPARRYVIHFDDGHINVALLENVKITTILFSHSEYTAWDPVYCRLHRFYWSTSEYTLTDCVSGVKIDKVVNKPLFVGVYDAVITIVSRRFSITYAVETGVHVHIDDDDNIVSTMTSMGDHLIITLTTHNVFTHYPFITSHNLIMRDLRDGAEYDMICHDGLQASDYLLVPGS